MENKDNCYRCGHWLWIDSNEQKNPEIDDIYCLNCGSFQLHVNDNHERAGKFKWKCQYCGTNYEQEHKNDLYCHICEIGYAFSHNKNL